MEDRKFTKDTVSMFPCPACGMDRRYREWSHIGTQDGVEGIFHEQSHECVNPDCVDDVTRYCWYCRTPLGTVEHHCVRSQKLNVEITEEDVKRWETCAAKKPFDAHEDYLAFLDTPIKDILNGKA